MKHIVVLALIGAFVFSGCDNATVDTPDSLIFEIAESVNKVNIDPADLPSNVQQVLEDDYFETYVETAALAPGKGYEVLLGNEDQVYFRTDGQHLRGSMRHDRHGPCGRGIPVRPGDLPEEITTYITDNYPDADILRGKRFVRGWVVLIGGRRLLLFDNDFAFIRETSVFHFCDGVGDALDLSDLREAIVAYVTEHYPNAQIIKAHRVRDKVVVGLLTPDGRIILVFDLDGNFLFQRG